MVRKTDIPLVPRPATDGVVVPAPALAPSRTASSVKLHQDAFEPAKAGAAAGPSAVSRPSAEEHLAELQMLRSLVKGDAEGAQEAREAMLAFRSLRTPTS